ncbi:MAG: hypothetical protein GDA49_02720 [Rhodospirillales bacterium]|nr:hypothetical protein [Rhodospirillales bacterium]
MTHSTTLLDPTSERSGGIRERKAPPASLDGLTVGLLDITKRQGDLLLDRLEARFGELGIKVERFAKETFAKKASDAVTAEITERCDVVVEALAD